MINKEKLYIELEEKFKETKEKLKFSSTFNEVNDCSFIKDMILEVGFVSDNFERQVCNRVVMTYYSWVGQFQAWLTAGMGSIINNNEVKAFTKEDIDTIKHLTHKAMYYFRRDKTFGIKKDYEGMGKLLDEMVKSKNDFFDKLAVLVEKTADYWEKE